MCNKAIVMATLHRDMISGMLFISARGTWWLSCFR